MEDLPAVVTFGVKELERGLARARAELASGAVVHVVSKSGGPGGGHARHRAWLTLEADPGQEISGRVSCDQFLKRCSHWLDHAEESGASVEVADNRSGTLAFYVSWCPPEALARVPGVLQFYTASPAGRLLLREFADATAVQVS